MTIPIYFTSQEIPQLGKGGIHPVWRGAGPAPHASIPHSCRISSCAVLRASTSSHHPHPPGLQGKHWSSSRFYKLQLHPFRHDLYCHFRPAAPRVSIPPPSTREHKKEKALIKKAFQEKASGGGYFQIEVVRQWTICSKIYFSACSRIFTKPIQKIFTYLTEGQEAFLYTMLPSTGSLLTDHKFILPNPA